MKTQQFSRDDHRARAENKVKLEKAELGSGAIVVTTEWLIRLLDDADVLEQWEQAATTAAASMKPLIIHRGTCAYCGWMSVVMSSLAGSWAAAAKHAATCKDNPLVKRVAELEAELAELGDDS
jgi:hypothetical protein